jgi:hypothetical protein
MAQAGSVRKPTFRERAGNTTTVSRDVRVLWVLFAVFSLHEHIIQHKSGIDLPSQRYVVFNAWVRAKSYNCSQRPEAWCG